MGPWIHGSAAGAAAAAVCIYYVLGAFTLGQRIKRDLASHGKNRGSCAGEHEQPNAGRKRKRHVFFLAPCWSNAVARAKARRNAECQDMRKANAKGVPADHADLPRRAKIEAQALQNASGRPVGRPKAIASR